MNNEQTSPSCQASRQTRRQQRGASSSPSQRASLRLRPLTLAVGQALCVLGAAAGLPAAYALPTGEQVVAGQVGFVRSAGATGAQLDITQASQRAIVNWQGFGIAAGDAVRLAQPAQGVALFRVVGNEPSQIFGSLTATGSLFLTNPNGVLFGAGSRVDVGALVASSLSIADADFNAGRYQFAAVDGQRSASVVNAGSITTARNGYAVLLGQTVLNSGSINALQGTVALGAAAAATLDVYGNGLLTLQLNSATDGARVDHSGSAQADGGRIQIAALGTAARPAAINVSGVLRADSLQERNGEIVLTASGAAATLTVTDSARLSADGGTGAGAGQNGGTLTLWSDDATSFAGRISARGASTAGNGGSAEISAANTLNVTGLADLSATNGSFGSLLLDPRSIDIVHGGNSNAAPNVLNDGYLAAQLATASVVVSTEALPSVAKVPTPRDITVSGDSNITWASPTTLTLLASHGIALQSGAVISNTNAGNNAFDAIVMLANQGGTSTFGSSNGIVLNGNVQLQTARGNISLNGTGGNGGNGNVGVLLNSASSIRTVDGSVTLTGIGGGDLNSASNPGGAGSGNHGVVLDGTAVVAASGSGAISVKGSAGVGPSGVGGVGGVGAAVGANDGIAFTSTGSSIGSATGSITLASDRLALTAGNTVQTGGTVLLQSVTGARAIDIGAADTDTTLGLDVAELNRISAGRLQIGTGAAGAINLSASFAPTGTQTLSLASAGAVTQSAGALLTVPNLALNAASVNLPNANNVGTLAASVRVNLVYNDADALTVGSVAGSSGAVNGVTVGNAALITAANGRLTLDQALRAGGQGDALTLVGQSFTNNAGANALATPAGRFVVYSQDPAADNRGGLAYAFKHYDCAYGGACTLGVPAAGNGFLYALVPVLTVAPAATVSVYGNAPAQPGSYTLAGFVDGDTAATAGISGSAVFTSNATAASSVGSYNVAYASGLASSQGYRIRDNARSTGELAITQRDLTLTPDAVSRVYGNASPVNGSATAGGSGLVNGDTVASVVLSAPLATAASNVGGYDLNASNAVFSSGAASNYAISYATRTAGLAVTARGLTLTPDAATRVYGNVNPVSGSATAGAGGLVNGDTVGSVTLASAANAGSNVDSYDLNASNAVFSSGLASNYAISYATRTAGLAVTARALTLTPDAASRVYGNVNPVSGSATAGAGGLVNGDAVGSVTLASAATTGSNVGSYDLSASNAVFSSGLASNYTISYATRTAGLAVTARGLTLTPDAASRVYGNTNPATGSATASVGGLVNGDTVGSVTLASAANAGSNVGSYDLSASNAVFGSGLASNYAISYATRTAGLAVTARALTLTPDAASRVYGNTNPATGSATASVGGLVNGDTVGSVTLASAANAGSNVGSYDLSASNAVFGSGAASNYAISYATRTAGLAVTARGLTLTPDAASRVYGNANPASGSATASAGGLVNGDAVGSVTLASAATATSNVGSYDLSASNAAFSSGLASNYTISYATRTAGLAVKARGLVLTPDATSRVYGNTNPATGSATASVGGLVNGDAVASVTLSTAATVTSNVGGYDLNASNAVFGSGAASNYAISYATRIAGLTVTARGLVLTPDAASRVYGNANPATGSATASAGGLVNGDTVGSVTLASAANAGSNVGSYDLSASNAAFSSGAASNYTISYATRTAGLTVTARNLTLTPVAASRTYGDANPLSGSATANAGGLVNGDTVASITLASAATPASNVGSYNLLASSAVFGSGSVSNYSIAYAALPAGLSVTARAITLTPTALTRVYGDANPSVDSAIVTAGSLVNGDTVAQVSVTAPTALATTNATTTQALLASNAVFGSGLASNYSIGYAPGTLGIGTRGLVIAALGGQSKTQGQPDPTLAYTVQTGSLVNGDSLSGSLVRSAGEAPGTYSIGLGTLTAGSNYALSFNGAAFAVVAAAVTPVTPVIPPVTVPVIGPIDRTPPVGTGVTNPLTTFLASLDSLAPTAAGPNPAGECVVDQPLGSAGDLIDRAIASTSGGGSAADNSRLTSRGIRLPPEVVDPCRTLPERRLPGQQVSVLNLPAR